MRWITRRAGFYLDRSAAGAMGSADEEKGSNSRRNAKIIAVSSSEHESDDHYVDGRGRKGKSEFGVGDGVRTRDIRCHRPTLYQLSYAHHHSDFIMGMLQW
jgi:hypothetical protein